MSSATPSSTAPRSVISRRSAGSSFSEKGVRSAQTMRVGHAFLWEYSYKRLQLAQLLGQLGVFHTYARASREGAAPATSY